MRACWSMPDEVPVRKPEALDSDLGSEDDLGATMVEAPVDFVPNAADPPLAPPPVEPEPPRAYIRSPFSIPPAIVPLTPSVRFE